MVEKVRSIMINDLKVDIKVKANDSHDLDCKVVLQGRIGDVRKAMKKLADDL